MNRWWMYGCRAGWCGEYRRSLHIYGYFGGDGVVVVGIGSQGVLGGVCDGSA